MFCEGRAKPAGCFTDILFPKKPEAKVSPLSRSVSANARKRALLHSVGAPSTSSECRNA